MVVQLKFIMLGVILINTLSVFSQVNSPKDKFNYVNKSVESILLDLNKRFKPVSFVFLKADLENTTSTTIVMSNATLTEFLDSLCRVQPLEYEKVKGVIIFSQKKILATDPADIRRKLSINVKVVDSRGRPIVGATVCIPKYNINGQTKKDGTFSAKVDGLVTEIIISHIGYKSDTVAHNSDPVLSVLDVCVPVVEEEVPIKYMQTHFKTTTGTISRVDGLQIGPRPGKNLFANLTGTAPGLISAPINGSFGVIGKLQIRNNTWLNLVNGFSAVTQNAPLILVDGVPLPYVIVSQLDFIGGKPNATGQELSGLTMLRSVNMDDIESIEILKDAEATALYGTKGANGVIIINTKKAKKDQPVLTFDFDAGVARSRVNLNYLNTKQYLQARREALRNDNQPITEENAPDLILFDTNRYVNYTDYFLGGVAHTLRTGITTGQANDLFGYLLRFGYYGEMSLLPGYLVGKKYYDRDIDVRGNLYQKSKDGRFTLVLSGSYLDGKTISISPDIAAAMSLAPNAPELIDSSGQFKWYKELINPLPYLLYTYTADIENVSGRLGIRYAVHPKIILVTNLGLLIHKTDEISIKPIIAQNPADMPKGEATFASLFLKNMFSEFKAEYKSRSTNFSTEVIAGIAAMRQEIIKDQTFATGNNSDILLPFLQAAGDLKGTNSITKYGYVSLFGNGKVIYKERYAVSVSARIDGSSRFGDNRKYAGFYGVGMGWTISKEKFFPDSGLLSYLKLKCNYGISGNDEIGDFAYKGLWMSNNGQRAYAGITTFYPTSHVNNEYGWGLCKKIEGSIDMTIDNFVYLTASYYHNTYTNQIVSESLPNFTGFGSIIKNNKAQTISQGLEFSMQSNVLKKDGWYWNASMSVTFPRTKLKNFPGLEKSNYASTLTVGVPVSAQKGLLYLGVNPLDGQYMFLDLDNNGQFNPTDYVVKGSLDPKLYGGLQNMIGIGQFTLDLSWEFAIQKGINQLLKYTPMRYNSNGFSNVPVQLLDRWQKTGDRSAYQMFSATAGSQALSSLDLLRSSSAQLVNANYLRLKMICLSYAVKPFKMLKVRPTGITFYAVAENALLITKYVGADPLTQNGSGIPLLKRYSIGVKLNIY